MVILKFPMRKFDFPWDFTFVLNYLTMCEQVKSSVVFCYAELIYNMAVTGFLCVGLLGQNCFGRIQLDCVKSVFCRMSFYCLTKYVNVF